MLTEEQKKKMEENRKKALEKRKRKEHTSPNKSCLQNNISSPPFKKRPISYTTMDQSVKANSNTSDIGFTSSQKTTLPKTSYSPSFKNRSTETTRLNEYVSKNNPTSPQRNLLRQTSYSPSFKRKTTATSERQDIAKNDHISLTPEKKTIPRTSYSPSFKKRNDGFTNDGISTTSCACPSRQTSEKNITSPEKKAIPKTSYSPSFKKRSDIPNNNNTIATSSQQNFEKNLTSPEKRAIPKTSYSPSFKKIVTQDGTQKQTFSAKRTIAPDLAQCATNEKVEQKEGQSQEQLTRSEMNRLKALEKLKMKQNETISTSSTTSKVTSPQHQSRSIFCRELSQRPEEGTDL